MNVTRYFEWDYDNDTVVEYSREGECNGCGACCLTQIIWRVNQTLKTPDGWDARNGDISKRAGLGGLVTEIRMDGKSRYFHNIRILEPNRCSMLTDDLKCKVHLGKRVISREWPMSPKHVTPFPECSYSFTEIGCYKISELEDGCVV